MSEQLWACCVQLLTSFCFCFQNGFGYISFRRGYQRFDQGRQLPSFDGQRKVSPSGCLPFTFGASNAIGKFPKDSWCSMPRYRALTALLPLVLQLVVASAQPVAGGAPVKRTVEFRSTRRGYKQRKALRKSKVHMAAQFEEAQDRVFSDSMLSDCPSCPVVHNLRDFQPQQASSQQVGATFPAAAWCF